MSENEHQNENGCHYFMVDQLECWTKKFKKLLKVINDAYNNNCSQRLKDQLIRREIDAPSKQAPPEVLPYGLGHFFRMTIFHFKNVFLKHNHIFLI